MIKKSITIYFLLLAVLAAGCQKCINHPYMKWLVEDLETSYKNGEPSTSRFENELFFIECNARGQYSSLVFRELYEGYNSRANKMSAEEYIDQLFNAEIRISEQICSPMDTAALSRYENNFPLLYKETIGLGEKYLIPDLKDLKFDVGTLLYLYFREGYLTGFDNDKGLMAVYKM